MRALASTFSAWILPRRLPRNRNETKRRAYGIVSCADPFNPWNSRWKSRYTALRKQAKLFQRGGRIARKRVSKKRLTKGKLVENKLSEAGRGTKDRATKERSLGRGVKLRATRLEIGIQAILERTWGSEFWGKEIRRRKVSSRRLKKVESRGFCAGTTIKPRRKLERSASNYLSGFTIGLQIPNFSLEYRSPW